MEEHHLCADEAVIVQVRKHTKTLQIVDIQNTHETRETLKIVETHSKHTNNRQIVQGRSRVWSNLAGQARPGQVRLSPVT